MAVPLYEQSKSINTLTPLESARLSSHSEEAEAKRREFRELVREDVILLRRQGMVPLGIADAVGRSVEWVVTILREEGFTIPGYLETTGGRARGDRCAKCGKVA
jgi:hypothetical protein